MPKFFAIEGLSASGKSATFDLMKDGPEFVGVPSIPNGFEGARQIFTDKAHVDARFLFFASAISFTSVSIGHLLEEGRNVIVESFIYRTASFHRGFGATADVQWPISMPMPNKIFFLHCEERVRLDRIKRRGRAQTIWDSLAERNRDRILDEYRRWDATWIDTTHVSPQGVVERILGEV